MKTRIYVAPAVKGLMMNNEILVYYSINNDDKQSLMMIIWIMQAARDSLYFYVT